MIKLDWSGFGRLHADDLERMDRVCGDCGRASMDLVEMEIQFLGDDEWDRDYFCPECIARRMSEMHVRIREA